MANLEEPIIIPVEIVRKGKDAAIAFVKAQFKNKSGSKKKYLSPQVAKVIDTFNYYMSDHEGNQVCTIVKAAKAIVENKEPISRPTRKKKDQIPIAPLTEQTLKNERAKALKNIRPEVIQEAIKELNDERAREAFAPFAPTASQTSPEN